LESLEQGLALDVVLWFQSLGAPWLAAALVSFHYLGSESFFGVWVGWAAARVFVKSGLAASRPPRKPLAVSGAGR
jgi:hypothetical protein